MSIIDKFLQFCRSQVVTATAPSTDVLDLGLAYGGQLLQLGNGEPLYLQVGLEVAMSDAGSDSTVTASLQTDDNSSFSSPTTLMTLPVFAAGSVAGTKKGQSLPAFADFERYVRVVFTVANGDLTTGTFNAQIVKDLDSYKAYQDAITITN